MTTDELRDHLKLLKVASRDDLDELRPFCVEEFRNLRLQPGVALRRHVIPWPASILVWLRVDCTMCTACLRHAA